MTGGQRDDLLMALGLIRGALTDPAVDGLPAASLKMAARLLQTLYDETRTPLKLVETR